MRTAPFTTLEAGVLLLPGASNSGAYGVSGIENLFNKCPGEEY